MVASRCPVIEATKVLDLATGTRIALIVEYEGTRYCGSQLQRKAPTVQSEVEEALWKLSGERIRVKMASRTDSGVHARGQVVSFSTRSSLGLAAFVDGMNYYLPEDIAVKASFRVDDSFDVRRNATYREYKYYILNSPTRSPIRRNFCHRVAGNLDTEAMNRACQALIGEHDFASFVTRAEAGKKSTVRRAYRAAVERNEDMVIFTIAANSFLPHQVRNTVGALLKVGLGKMTVEEFNDLVQAKSPNRAGPTAPSQGLCLTRIDYPGPLEKDIE